MNKRVLMSLSDEMYSAIKVGYPDDPIVEHSVETLRAIQYCLEYIFVHVEYRGTFRMMAILDGAYDEPLSSKEKAKYIALSGELSKKISVLNSEILQLVSDAYIAINIERRIPKRGIMNHGDAIRAKIQDKFSAYLKETGGSQESFKLIVKSVLAHLKFISEAPQEDRIKRYELMHTFKGGIIFMEHLFNLNYGYEKHENNESFSSNPLSF
jgi:hypothetical protein